MTTRVFIIPAEHKDAGNTMSEHMGWGEPVYVQPLSATGQEPITHWGFPAVISPEFLELWGNPPPEAVDLVAATYTDTREGDGTTGHWYDVLAELGLTQVVLEEQV